jgi:hypothetical protein
MKTRPKADLTKDIQPIFKEEHHDMSLIQCRQALIHHIIIGTCFENPSNLSDAASCSRQELSTCRAISRGYSSAADVSQAALNIILNADREQMPTEHYCHVAAAMNISVSGTRNLRFKLRAAIRKNLFHINLAESVNRCSASVADFFNSFESHRKPVLIAIAAFHRINIPPKANAEDIRTEITKHIISGHCARFSASHASAPDPLRDISLPDCAVWKGWMTRS